MLVRIRDSKRDYVQYGYGRGAGKTFAKACTAVCVGGGKSLWIRALAAIRGNDEQAGNPTEEDT